MFGAMDGGCAFDICSYSLGSVWGGRLEDVEKDLLVRMCLDRIIFYVRYHIYTCVHAF